MDKRALVKEAWPENLLKRHLNASEVGIAGNGCLLSTNLPCSQKELAAFTAYAIAFPEAFLALIDTYAVVSIRCSCCLALRVLKPCREPVAATGCCDVCCCL